MTGPAGREGEAPRRADVEGLRAVAVLLVLADHLLGAPVGGFVGVDVFFVISGYLITGLLVGELARTGTLRLRAFYSRRARRLLPAALLVLAVTTVAAQLLFLPVRAGQTARDALFAAGSVANWRFASLGTDYFSSTRPPSPVQHYWSLSVEEQFYLAWPAVLLVVALGWRRRRRLSVRRLAVGVGAVLVASLAWSVAVTASDPQAAYFSTPARVHELAAGALLALLLPRVRVPTAVAAGLSALGLAGIAAAALLLSPATPFPGAAALAPVLATCAVLAADGRGPSRLLALAPMRYVGRISYSLYLWHWPVGVLGAAALPERPAWLPWAAVGLSVGLAALTAVLVEEPLRRAAPALLTTRPRSSWRTAALPALLGVSLLTVGAAAVGTPGSPDETEVSASGSRLTTVPLPGGGTAQGAPRDAWRSTDDLAGQVRRDAAADRWGPLEPPLEALESAAAPEWVRDDCLDVFPTTEARCVYGSRMLPRTAVLLGDSVAISWLPGLRAALEPQGFRLHVLTRRQCSLAAADEAVSPGCRAHREHVLQRAAAMDPDLVLVSGSASAAARALEVTDAPAWRTQLAASLRRLVPTAGRVVVLGAPPQTGNLLSCATRVSPPGDCVRPVRDVWQAVTDAERAAAQETGAGHVDPLPWSCADRRCPAAVGGTPVAFDGTHLTAAHSRRLALLLRLAVRAAGGPPGWQTGSS